nr:hypothetical protein [Tanacetum cinerariifolium]
MGEPLSLDHVFDFIVDEPEPHPAYNFFAPRPLLGYAGYLNNNNGWIEADMPLLGELGVEFREVNEEWLMAPVTPPLMPAVPPPSVYEVGGPSTTAAATKGQSFPVPAPGLPIPPSVIEDFLYLHR